MRGLRNPQRAFDVCRAKCGSRIVGVVTHHVDARREVHHAIRLESSRPRFGEAR